MICKQQTADVSITQQKCCVATFSCIAPKNILVALTTPHNYSSNCDLMYPCINYHLQITPTPQWWNVKKKFFKRLTVVSIFFHIIPHRQHFYLTDPTADVHARILAKLINARIMCLWNVVHCCFSDKRWAEWVIKAFWCVPEWHHGIKTDA